jgi:tripartite ATP-independent transporter DctP family solute receptor
MLRSAVSLIAVAAFAAFLPIDAQAGIKFNLAYGGDATPAWHTAAKQFAEEVRTQSHGALEVQLYTGGQNGSDREMLEAMQSGSLQISAIPTKALTRFEPSLQIFDLPYLLPTYETAYKVLDGEIGQQIAEQLKKKGLRNLAYWENDYRQLSNSERPLVAVEDVAGLKISVSETPIMVAWLQALKAMPTIIDDTQLYASLQQRVVDGQDHGIFRMYSARYYEVQAYCTLTNHVYEPVAFLINERFFQTLSPAHRHIIQQAAGRARDYQRSLNKTLRNERLNEMKRSGLKVSELSPQARHRFRASARPVYEKMTDAVDIQLLQKILDVQ